MQFQYESFSRDPVSYADSKFHNYSTSTDLYLNDEYTGFNQVKESQQHFDHQLPEQHKNNNAFDQTSNVDSLPIAKEIIQITHRFERIQQLLLRHSEHQSILHEKVYGFKEMAIDWTQLCPDFSNKISIVEDLRHLLAVAEREPSSQDIKELLESKFQEYYLQRHYGGLKCEINDLSIQERGQQFFSHPQFQISEPKHRQQIQYEQLAFGYAQQDSGYKQQSSGYGQQSSGCHQLQCLSSVQRSEESLEYINLKQEKEKKKKNVLSTIGGFVSLVNESKLTYTQDCCQTNEENFSISVEIPRFIQIDIPVIIYRVKQQIITYDESGLEAPYKDIDQIIQKYSKPYEELYLDSKKQIKNSEEQELLQFNVVSPHPTPLQSLQVGSIMLDSNVIDNRASREMTEVELSYSQLPEEQLLIDSFAQIGSLISNSENFGQQRSRRNSSDDTHIVITEKLNSRSILQKYEESERILNEENLELKEKVNQLQSDLQESEKKRKEVTAMNKKLADRLEEEIEQGIYLNKKLDELDAELLEEKVSCLTRLNDCKERKIDTITAQLKQKTAQLEALRYQLAGLRVENEKTEELLTKREDELALVSKQLEERQQELYELNNCQDDIIKIVSETEISLKYEIEKLEQEKIEMRERLTEFQRRVESEGLNLQYEQAKQIQGIIESREHIFSIELKEVTDKYEEIISNYKQQLEEARHEVMILNELNQAKSQLHDTCTTVKEKKLSDNYLNEFEAIIEQYNQELQNKDDEILQLKFHLKLAQREQTFKFSDDDECLSQAFMLIDTLARQLEKERIEKMSMTQKLVNIDKMLSNSTNALQCEPEFKKYEELIEQLTHKLEKMLAENSNLKEKIAQANLNKLQTQHQELSTLRRDVEKLRKVNSKLKKYTVEMESELISISGMSRCQSHKLLIAKITEQRNYYMNLLTKG